MSTFDRGVITYAMNLGKLPFSSLSSDDYHKHKMLQQIQKGLSVSHEKEMQILSASNLSTTFASNL